MKIPSIKQLWIDLVAVLKRFPLVMSMAALGSASGILLVDQAVYIAQEDSLVNVLITSVLGFLLFLALRFYSEREKSKTAVLQLLALAFLVVYYLLLPDHYQGNEFEHVLRSILYGIAFFMAITFSPFLKQKELNGFWQHNRYLFTRVFFTGLYTGTLYLGLVLALFSLESLFDVSVQSEFYFQLWIAIVGLVSTSFFLSGIPADLSSLEKLSDYPKGIRVFSQYILLPLLALYFVILYSYTGKILITGIWPEGIISTLIIVFSFLAVFTHFLLHPLSGNKSYLWVGRFAKWIYVFILPMIAILFWAITIRISEYGLTEKRYYVIAIGIWLLLTSFYFIFSRKKSLKFIPISIFTISLLTSFGPWGALDLSKTNQLGRLEALLSSNGLLSSEGITSSDLVVADEDQRSIQNILYYLSSYHGLSVLSPWFENLDAISLDCKTQVSCIMTDILGLENQSYSYYDADYLNLYLNDKELLRDLDISAYNRLIPELNYYAYSNDLEIKNGQLEIELEDGIVQVDLSGWLESLKSQSSGEVDLKTLSIIDEEKTLILNHVNINNISNDPEIQSFNGFLLLP